MNQKLKRYSFDWDGCEPNSSYLIEKINGDYVKFSDVAQLIDALKRAKWFHEHVMGDTKRVDWGKTFDIDWMGVNDALIAVDEALKSIGVEV